MTEMATGRGDLEIEAKLDALAREVADGSPRPGPDLVARVLADAASVPPVATGAETPMPTAQASTPGFLETLLSWTGGAVAAMALSLAIGIGIGMELEPGYLPMTETDLVDDYIAASADLMQDEFL